MTDIALIVSDDGRVIDVQVLDGTIVVDDGLRTAMLISLFTDARARGDDPLPHAGADRRGWWGNGFAADDDAAALPELGSRLWLLEREKLTDAVVERARGYAAEALAWLTADGIVSALGVEAVRIAPATLGLRVVVDRPDGPARQIYDFVWNASLAAPASLTASEGTAA